jgi:HlyD family secretion protein
MVAVIYVPISSAPDLKTGQEVQVSPLNVQQSQYGFIRGRVASIAESVATYNDMLRVLGREEFVQSILSQAIMVEVRIELERDPETVSGYLWSSKTAQSIQLQTGTPCYASVTIKEERPISRVFPIFGLLLPVFGLIFIQPVHLKVN